MAFEAYDQPGCKWAFQSAAERERWARVEQAVREAPWESTFTIPRECTKCGAERATCPCRMALLAANRTSQLKRDATIGLSQFPHIRRLSEVMTEPAPVGAEERSSEPWRYAADKPPFRCNRCKDVGCQDCAPPEHR